MGGFLRHAAVFDALRSLRRFHASSRDSRLVAVESWFSESAGNNRASNGVRYLSEYTNGVICAKVTESFDYGTHTLFIADVTESFLLSNEPSVTYQYYFDHIKPKPQPPKAHVNSFICKICGYVYEGDSLPDDYICPLCKHGAADFERNI